MHYFAAGSDHRVTRDFVGLIQGQLPAFGQMQQQRADVLAVHLTGMIGRIRRQVCRPQDRDAMHVNRLIGLCQFAVAAERGGNCELTKADETVHVHGVTILGPTNLPSDTAYHASQMYGKNISTLLLHLTKGGQLTLDQSDEITRDTVVTSGGEVVHSRVRDVLGLPALAPASA